MAEKNPTPNSNPTNAVSASELHTLQNAINNAIKPDGVLFDANDPPNKKMKFSSNEDDTDSLLDNDGKPSGKVSHNAIEKRRRDKMNMYIDELAAMVPMCSVVSRRPDKLTILKMAVRHLKALRYANGGGHKNQLRPTFLTDEELKHLILEAEDGFLFIVSCENQRILYASNSVSHVLNHTKEDLCELGFLDIIHPCDQELVKEQLLVTDCDHTAGEKKSTSADFNMISGSRRSFFCRMRHGKRGPDGQTMEDKKKNQNAYTIVHVTGYLKNWDVDTFSMSEDLIKYSGDESEEELGDFTCLVAVGRILQVPVKSLKQPNVFNWRLTMDDKFLFVDPRTTAVLEYLPHELIGTSIYKFYHPSDLSKLTDAHQKVKTGDCKVMYRFRTKSGRWVWLHGSFQGFNNPFSGQLQYIICNNIAVLDNNELDDKGRTETGISKIDLSGKPKMSTDMGHIISSSQLMQHTSQPDPIQQQASQMGLPQPMDSSRSPHPQSILDNIPDSQAHHAIVDLNRPTNIVTPNVELCSSGRMQAKPSMHLDQITRMEVDSPFSMQPQHPQPQHPQQPQHSQQQIQQPPQQQQQQQQNRFRPQQTVQHQPQHHQFNIQQMQQDQYSSDMQGQFNLVQGMQQQQQAQQQQQQQLPQQFNPQSSQQINKQHVYLPQMPNVHNIRTKEQYEQARLYNERERQLLQEYEHYLKKTKWDN